MSKNSNQNKDKMITINDKKYEVEEIVEDLFLNTYEDHPEINCYEIDLDSDFSLSDVKGIFDKNWHSMEEVFDAILEEYSLKTYSIWGERYFGLVSRQIDDNYGLGPIKLKIYDDEKDQWQAGDLNSLFGFNYDMGRFDPECNRVWSLTGYDISYHEIIKALANDDTRSFSSLDDFIDFVSDNKKFTLFGSIKHHIINSDKCATQKLLDFLYDIVDASIDDAIKTTNDEHETLISFVDEIADTIENLKVKDE